MADLEKVIQNSYGKPLKCEECGETKLDYKGLGEYKCSKCGLIMFDEYGLVRNFLDKHPGATQVEVAKETGVSKAHIRAMLKDDKIEISKDSLVFMTCEKCGAEIRSGRLCSNCLVSAVKDTVRNGSSHILGGHVAPKTEGTGTKRFKR